MVSVDVIKQKTLRDLSSLAQASGISGGRRAVFRSLCSQLGPCFHKSLTDTSVDDDPRDSMSAGLLLPEQWSQHSTGTSRLISLTRFCINGFQSFSALLIQQRLI